MRESCSKQGSIVFVDDDEGEPDTEGYFEDLLTRLDKQFVTVEPSDAIGNGGAKAGLEQFRVIWNCGQYGYLDDAEQAAVADFLDKGGRLFLMGPEVMWVLDPEESDFARNYLHVVGKEDDVGTTKVTGVAGDPISDGLEITLDFEAWLRGWNRFARAWRRRNARVLQRLRRTLRSPIRRRASLDLLRLHVRGNTG
ncbi:MAG: hypothetical protein ACOX4C_02325 [Bacillota bacterium]